MKTIADDYYNNGRFEIARFGRLNIMKNIMSPRQHRRYTETLKSSYFDLKKEINNLISVIRSKVIDCEPIELLSFSRDIFFRNMMGVESEIQASGDDVNISRMTEYVQSIFVSSPLTYKESNERSDPSKKFFSIQKDIEHLYELVYQFYLSWGLNIKDNKEWDNEIIDTAVESQMLYLVRGQRYQAFEIEYYEKLLCDHNDIINNLFEMTACDVIEGIKKLQYSLSQGKIDALNKLRERYEEYTKSKNIDREKYFKEHRKEGQEFYDEFFGTKLNDVIGVTGWNEKFVRELSYSINEESTFFNQADFSGWPVIDLPIQRRPFIKIGSKYYCFDYYSFMDNFYRSMQKTISRLAPLYSWSTIQQNSSEKMVESIFQQLLPNCIAYRNNYYPQNGSIKHAAENDLIIQYSNTLIIIEVKAGSFVYTPPLTDFEAHIKSYKTLIEKADWQCKRTFDYLTSQDKSPLYDEQHNIKDVIDMSDIKDIFMMSITVDNINDFAARAEKLNFLQLKCNAISISVDDLMVYREYFESPLYFLHFLKQRKKATQVKKIALNDELDHLGMYIAHNFYTNQTEGTPRNTRIQFYGYRENLDKYFCSLYHPQLHREKPQQSIPDLFKRIINFLDKNDVNNKVEIANYLLDFSIDYKSEFCEQVNYVFKRQSEIKDMVVLSAAGTGESLRYTCFINQPNINIHSDEDKLKRTLSALLWNQDADRVLLDLYFDENFVFYDLKYKKLVPEDIHSEEVEELRVIGEQIVQARFEKYKSTTKSKRGKVGRNQFCPCGSGKKYKKCCGLNKDKIK